MTDQAATAAAPAPDAEKPPSQQMAERMLAARDKLAQACDLLEDLMASVHGRARPSPSGAIVSGPPADLRRFFPAMDRLISDVESEAARIMVLAEGLDRSF